MAKAYILASKGKSLTSKIIRFWQYGHPVTHIAYIYDYSDKNDPFVIEAWPGGVWMGSFSVKHTPGTEFDVYTVDVTEEQKQEIEDFLYEQLGKPYDWPGILGFPLRNKNIEDPDKWFCSELVFTAFKHAGVELLKRISPAEVSPRIFLFSPYLQYVETNILTPQ